MTLDTNETVDVFVIGGGINGVGVARDATGRGFSVCLCEANDLASGTSSASSKLIHGGLRYLEHYEFGLVRKALQEREVLLTMAPHIISPMRFILPHSKELRPWWLLRIGLFLYDHLGHRKILPGTRDVDLSKDPAGEPLKSEFRKGFEYSDCWVDDARLVILNAMDAAQNGAQIRVRTKVTRVRRQNGLWVVTTKDITTGEVEEIPAKVVVNAAGPWVDEVLNSALGAKGAKNVRLVRGSHIVVRKRFDHDRSYIFQNADDRIIFAIPYEEDFTLIGTTDIDHGAKVGSIEIDEKERQYLCNCANEYFKNPVLSDDIVWSYSGVRPLYDDGASEAKEATRDYIIETEDKNGALLINIFGGKITTYRRLSETILSHVEKALGKRGDAWTAGSKLPGGNFAVHESAGLVDHLQSCFAFIDRNYLERLVRLYGTMSKNILGNATSLADLGLHFGAGLYQAEVDHLISSEWAVTVDDILFRRTKIGIVITKSGVDKLATYLGTRTQREASQDYTKNGLSKFERGQRARSA